MRIERGFTMPELVAVLIITGILSLYVASAFNRRDYDSPAFAAQVRAQLAYAQKVAVATRRTVTVNVAGNNLTTVVCQTEACGASTNLPTLQGNVSLTPPAGSGIALASVPTSFTFDPRGRSNGAVLTIGPPNVQVTVTVDTGYVF